MPDGTEDDLVTILTVKGVTKAEKAECLEEFRQSEWSVCSSHNWFRFGTNRQQIVIVAQVLHGDWHRSSLFLHHLHGLLYGLLHGLLHGLLLLHFLQLLLLLLHLLVVHLLQQAQLPVLPITSSPRRHLLLLPRALLLRPRRRVRQPRLLALHPRALHLRRHYAVVDLLLLLRRRLGHTHAPHPPPPSGRSRRRTPPSACSAVPAAPRSPAPPSPPAGPEHGSPPARPSLALYPSVPNDLSTRLQRLVLLRNGLVPLLLRPLDALLNGTQVAVGSFVYASHLDS